MSDMEQIKWPIYTRETIDKVVEVFDSNRYTISGYWTGSRTYEQEFAEAFAAFNGVPYCVPTANGSSSLLVALEALDVGYGDEVIVPALTWLATATAVLNINALPVLVDVDPDTYCIDLKQIEEKITEKTKAIIPVHLYGCMTDMDGLLEIAQKYRLKIIEDCAQTHGSFWNGQKAGTLGDIGAFSFQQSKTLSSGEGGCVITKDPVLFERLSQLRADSRVFSTREMKFGDIELIGQGTMQGSNYCMTEFQAAILLEQLTKLDDMNRLREENARYLDDHLSQIQGIKTMKRMPQIQQQSYFSYCVRIDTDYFKLSSDQNLQLLREKMQKLLKERLGLGPFFLHAPYPAINKNRLFCPWTKRRFPSTISHTESFWREMSFPIAEKASKEGVVFHHSVLLQSREYMDNIINAFNDVISMLKDGRRVKN